MSKPALKISIGIERKFAAKYPLQKYNMQHYFIDR
jgi:hypothetical protein